MAAPETLAELASVRASSHPSLAATHLLGPDIFPSLLTWVFEDERFETWQKSDKNWQLRCCGTPGSGKTTLAALAIDHLKTKYDGARHAVLSVFIQHDVLDDEASFLEDFLLCLVDQLVPTCLSAADDIDDTSTSPASVHLQEYLGARKLRQRTTTRLHMVRTAVASCLAMADKAFLVVDGLDRCSAIATLALEDQFECLRGLGLRIMTTSRIPCLEEPVSGSMAWCDGPACPDTSISLSIFWECRTCRTPDNCFVLCVACMGTSVPCKNCGNNCNLLQPYEFVEIDISTAARIKLKELAAWSLESEHGHLGLDSNARDKPPLSAFGITVQASQTGDQLATDVAAQADHNIALARARLETIHLGNTLAETGSVGDRLPDSIITLFDAAMRRIERQPPFARDLGLAVTATVADAGSKGIPVEAVANAVRVWCLKKGSVSALPRCLEDILRATQGLIVADVPQGEEERYLQAYCADFLTYAAENYCDSLIWAHMHLRVDGRDGMAGPRRSATYAAPPPLKWKERAMPVPDPNTEVEEPGEMGVPMAAPRGRVAFRMKRPTRRATGMS